METTRKKKILLLAVRAGEIMMKSGAEIYRVEETITRICKACKIDNVEVFAMPTGIFVTLDNDVAGDNVSTYISRIHSSETDLNKIHIKSSRGGMVPLGRVRRAKAHRDSRHGEG